MHAARRLLTTRLPPAARAARAPRRMSTLAAAKTALVPVADGSEEMEAVIIVDVLRRAGVATTLASVEPGRLAVTCSRGVTLVADALLADAAAGAAYDAVVLPGGMPGAERLRDCAQLTAIVQDQHAAGRVTAAICAAPAVALQPAGVLDGRKGEGFFGWTA